MDIKIKLITVWMGEEVLCSIKVNPERCSGFFLYFLYPLQDAIGHGVGF